MVAFAFLKYQSGGNGVVLVEVYLALGQRRRRVDGRAVPRRHGGDRLPRRRVPGRRRLRDHLRAAEHVTSARERRERAISRARDRARASARARELLSPRVAPAVALAKPRGLRVSRGAAGAPNRTSLRISSALCCLGTSPSLSVYKFLWY